MNMSAASFICTGSNNTMPRRVSEHHHPRSITMSRDREQNHFPHKLYAMLEYVADSEYSSAVSWSPGGASFAIHDKEAFMQCTIPSFFNQTKFRSFTRQLNIWGFKRIGNSELWQHEHFVRGKFDELNRIDRVSVKNNPKPKLPKNATRKVGVKSNKSKQARQPQTSSLTRQVVKEQAVSRSVSSGSEGSNWSTSLASLYTPVRINNKFPEKKMPILQDNNIVSTSFQPPIIWRPTATTSYNDDVQSSGVVSASSSPVHSNYGSISSTITGQDAYQQTTGYTSVQDTYQHVAMYHRTAPHYHQYQDHDVSQYYQYQDQTASSYQYPSSTHIGTEAPTNQVETFKPNGHSEASQQPQEEAHYQSNEEDVLFLLSGLFDQNQGTADSKDDDDDSHPSCP